MKHRASSVILLIGAFIFVYSLCCYSNLNAFAVSPQISSDNTSQGNSASNGYSIQGMGIDETATQVREGDAKVKSKFVIDNTLVDPDNSCELCTKITYTPGAAGVAGLAYKDDILNLDNSGRVVFFAKSTTPEEVTFVAAGNDTKTPVKNDTDIFPKIDFAVVTKNVTLDKDWRRFEIRLNNSALTDATYPFGLQLASHGSKLDQEIYIKGVTLDSKSPVNPLPEIFDRLNSTSVVNSTQPLAATINSNYTNGTAPATIGFNANATGGAAPYSYSWKFGDGTNATSTDKTALHEFANVGSYNVTLAVKDSSSPSQNASASLLISVASPGNLAVNGTTTEQVNSTQPLAATINSNYTNGTAPATIGFNANATGGAAPYSYSWKFGDGTNATSTDKTALHEFANVGSYNVTLAVKDSSSPSQNASASLLISMLSTKPALETNDTAPSQSSLPIEINSTAVNATTLVKDNLTTTTNSTGNTTGNSNDNFTATGNGGNNSPDLNSTNNSQTNQTVGESLSLPPSYSEKAVNVTGSIKPILSNNNSSSSAKKSSGLENVIRPIESGNLGSENSQRLALENATKNPIRVSGDDPVSIPISSNQNSPPSASSTNIQAEKDKSVSPTLTVEHVTAATPSNTAVDIVLKAKESLNDGILKFSILNGPSHGKVADPAQIDAASAKVTYSPDNDYSGTDSFQFTASDANNHLSQSSAAQITVFQAPTTSGQTTVALTQKSNDQAPVALAQSLDTLQGKSLRISLKSEDNSNNAVKFTITSTPQHGKLTGFNPSTGRLSYKSDSKFIGSDSFFFKVTAKGGSDSAPAEVSINVKALGKETTINNKSPLTQNSINEVNTKDSPVKLQESTNNPSSDAGSGSVISNHKPSANAGADSVIKSGSQVTLNGTGSDPDNDLLTYSWKQIAGPHTVLKNADTNNPVLLAPNLLKDKTISFELRVSDSKGAVDSDVINLLVRHLEPVKLGLGQQAGVTEQLTSGNSTRN